MKDVTRRGALKRLVVAAGSAALAGTPVFTARQTAAGNHPPTTTPALRRSDVVFMYEAEAAVYRDYGATVLAWGGTPTRKSLAEARGLAFYGSVGMVTEFPRYHDRFPDTWRDGLCLDVDGRPIKVPWLVDLSHRGEPYWWCCTRQPVFRQYLEERVARTLSDGAHGLHVDDHLGSGGALFLAACFCPRCVEAFGAHLASLDAGTRERLGIDDPAGFDYGSVLRLWRAAAPAGTTRRASEHPLWPEWRIFQLQSAAAYMEHLRAVAERAAGRRVPVSANAGLLWPNHLADYRALDFFSAEIDHEAQTRAVSDRPLFAYRIADSMGRMLAATARGEDWAAILAEGRHRLALSWAALGYASGHMLMAPHHQWCHTEAKGTHWYDGPDEVFAPFFRFVGAHARLLDGFEPWADVALVVPHRAFAEAPARWIAMGETLAAANVAYRVVIGGDEVVPREITASDLADVQVIVNPEAQTLQNEVSARIAAAVGSRPVVSSVEDAIRLATPVVRANTRDVRVLPRIAGGRAVVHLVNRAYDPDADAVRARPGVELTVDLHALGVPGASRARIASFGGPERETRLVEGRLSVDVPGPWTIVELS